MTGKQRGRNRLQKMSTVSDGPEEEVAINISTYVNDRQF